MEYLPSLSDCPNNLAPGFHLAINGGLLVGGGGAGLLGAVDPTLQIVVFDPLALPALLENFLFPFPLKSCGRKNKIVKTVYK